MQNEIENQYQYPYTYESYVERLGGSLAALNPKTPLFTVDTDGLWEIYLANIPEADRQHHTCNTCRHWFRDYAGIVVIDPETGDVESPLWTTPSVPAELRHATVAVRNAVVRRPIANRFLQPSNQPVAGHPELGGFHHFHTRFLPTQLYSNKLLTAAQRMAELREAFGGLNAALNDFKVETLMAVIRVLEADAVTRAEKFLAHAQWLHKAAKLRNEGKVRRNLLWLMVADAPDGWCFPRNQMIGTLLFDLQNGVKLEDAVRAWKTKMHPLQYQRPTAPPTAGQVLEAERRFSALGLERSIQRRFAKLSDMRLSWAPTIPKGATEPVKGGLFGHLLRSHKGSPRIDLSGLKTPVMTWRKFREEILPKAQELLIDLPHRGDFIGFTTAVHQDAEILLRWDRPEDRNPVGYYRWLGGSSASQWHCSPGWTPVAGITNSPAHWTGAPCDDKTVIFLLLDAWESQHARVGLALFPENMRSDLHGVRAVIEAHSKQGRLEGAGEEHAVGFGFDGRGTVKLKVRTGEDWTVYTVDRLD
jgi:hypothetical protein